jgi:glyoxylase-like metal-dependent hydrolase (beta-lactamase superfamily II)
MMIKAAFYYRILLVKGMSMKIGSYEIIEIETGRFSLDGGAMFGIVPKNLWSQLHPSDEENRIVLAMRSLLLKSSDRLIIIETGAGTKFNEKLLKIYDIDYSSYSLAKSFDNLGLSYNDVTDVILTHLHFDHAGGSTYWDSDKLKLTFPHAQHYIQSDHWQWAHGDSEKELGSFFEDDFEPIEKMGKLTILDGGCEVAPGIDILPFYGHTQAMQLIKVSDNKTTLFYCSDLIPTAAHIALLWNMAYDNNPLITIEEKKRILKQALNEKWIFYYCHDPFRAASTVKLTSKGYALDQEIHFNS